MQTSDPKGFYAALGVSPGADANEIKAAFRRKAMEYHPDRNGSPSATKQFQLINEAYGVLSDPVLRSKYDTSLIDSENKPSASGSAKSEKPEPIVCSCCGKVSAQPRYAIFFTVTSFIVQTSRSVTQGIFCSACAAKKATKATLITWALGWWGIPWGPIYTLQAIFTNLVGGKQPPEANARLAAYQAWFFFVSGKHQMAKSIALDAMDFAKKISDGVSNSGVANVGAELRAQIDRLLGLIELTGETSSNRLKNSWGLLQRPFFFQSTFSGLLLGTLCLFSAFALIDNHSPRTGRPYASGSTISTTPQAKQQRYVRPELAPNGAAWPKIADYVNGYPIFNSSGHSVVTIDNTQNNSDVFVKLVSLDGENSLPVRTLFIPAHWNFPLKSVAPGNYDIRYRNLTDGYLSRSERFTVTENPKADGIEYSNITLTLYKVRQGNLKTYGLDEVDF